MRFLGDEIDTAMIVTIFPIFISAKRIFGIKELGSVLIGRKTIVGIKSGKTDFTNIKQGLISLADLSLVSPLPEKARTELNEYYLKNYTVSLDFEILIKYFLRK